LRLALGGETRSLHSLLATSVPIALVPNRSGAFEESPPFASLSFSSPLPLKLNRRHASRSPVLPTWSDPVCDQAVSSSENLDLVPSRVQLRIAADSFSKEKRDFPYRHAVAIYLLVLVRLSTARTGFAQPICRPHSPTDDEPANQKHWNGFASSELAARFDYDRKDSLHITNGWRSKVGGH
jgi:hypothetical protein